MPATDAPLNSFCRDNPAPLAHEPRLRSVGQKSLSSSASCAVTRAGSGIGAPREDCRGKYVPTADLIAPCFGPSGDNREIQVPLPPFESLLILASDAVCCTSLDSKEFFLDACLFGRVNIVRTSDIGARADGVRSIRRRRPPFGPPSGTPPGSSSDRRVPARQCPMRCRDRPSYG